MDDQDKLKSDMEQMVRDVLSNIIIFKPRPSSQEDREKLVPMFEAADLTEDQQFMVYKLFAVYGTKRRVLEAIDKNSPGKAWVDTLRMFVTDKIAETVGSEDGRFPAIRIPSTNPGMDLLCFLISTPHTRHTIGNLARRATFAQIALSPEMQAEAKLGYFHHWEDMGVTPPATFVQESLYKGRSADMYHLLGTLREEVPFKGDRTCYDEQDILEWMCKVDVSLEKLSLLELLEKGYFEPQDCVNLYASVKALPDN
ncbi:hypothetical protein QBC43DRAFT_16118 [Cladorrhinum sp. PSN259]|nr:hypothetical protein QBC43DRAFT_16118 [Cladorrhinum sp. PSN259]